LATRFVFDALSAEYPASNAAAFTLAGRHPVLAFDAATAETAYFSGIVPVGWTGTITAYIYYMMASATSGKVDFTVAVEAVTPGDALDMDAGDSFDTANTITAPTVPGTAGYMNVVSCTLTNNDSSAAGDYIRFSLVRDATDATNDTATGDAYVLKFEVRDGA
jgi:hypothetical protein